MDKGIRYTMPKPMTGKDVTQRMLNSSSFQPLVRKRVPKGKRKASAGR